MRVIESEGNINKHPFDMPVCVSIIASSITSDHCLQPSVYRISSAGRKDCHPAPWIWKEMNLRCVFFSTYSVTNIPVHFIMQNYLYNL